MKIGIVTTWFERGAAYVSRQFMETLQSLGHEVYIYARGGEEFAKGISKWDLENVTWNKFLYSPVPTDIDRVKFENWLDANEIEAVIFNEQQYWQPVLWVKNKKIFTIAYIDYYTDVTVKLFDVYDQLWCNTKRHASAFEWHDGMQYLPWGTNVDLFKPQNTIIKKNEDKVVFFHSAGLNPYRKGSDFVILAGIELLKQGVTNFKIVIHTQTDLLKFFPELKGSIKNLIETGSLEIVKGTVSAPGLYHLGDVYIYPSRLEGIGLTIAEAMSCGLPVIVTNEEPMNEFVDLNTCSVVNVTERKKRKDGYYWPMAFVDIVELSSSMIKYIRNPEFLQEAKINVRGYALNNLDFNKNKVNIQIALDKLFERKINIKVLSKVDEIDRMFTKYYFLMPKLSRKLFGFLITIKRKFFR